MQLYQVVECWFAVVSEVKWKYVTLWELIIVNHRVFYTGICINTFYKWTCMQDEVHFIFQLSEADNLKKATFAVVFSYTSE